MQSPRNQTTLKEVAHRNPVVPPHLGPPRPTLGALPTELQLEIGSYITLSAQLYTLLRVNRRFYAVFRDILYKIPVRALQRDRLITTRNLGAVRRLLANGLLDIEADIEYPPFEESWYMFKSKMLFEAICLHDLCMVQLLLKSGASTAECQMDASARTLEMGKLLAQHGTSVRAAASAKPIILCLLVREFQPGQHTWCAKALFWEPSGETGVVTTFGFRSAVRARISAAFSEMKADFRRWKQFLSLWNGIAIIRTTREHHSLWVNASSNEDLGGYCLPTSTQAAPQTTFSLTSSICQDC
ncbi:hypothetical protein FN846DRAFT_910901 [Sphaerosporella brunnea]|uniref:F-box domain-containing protein n=1 Tax=Sphaerosporella brunnea TaxID=1250544 RepID=A0A5J5EM52_9PEZI|nr:hypothetical protein FN846DRAFT_910901 [Sphaerosporella brunnea]